MTTSGLIVWFFGENGSTVGVSTPTRSGGIISQAYSRREKTETSASATIGQRNSHACLAKAFGSSRPR